MEPEDTWRFHGPSVAGYYCPTLAYMKAGGEFCDVTICAGDESFLAHRVILGAAIPYFRALFSSNMMEAKQRKITLKNVDPLALKGLLNFVYTNDLEITTANVLHLLETSMYLSMDVVTDACFEFLYERIDSSTVFAISKYAQLLNKVDMMDNADRYVKENFEDVSTSAEFISLPIDALKNLISSDDLLVVREEIVFEAVMRWVKASAVERQACLPELLNLVRMPLLNPEFLNTRVSSEDLIRESPACVDIVNATKRHHARPITMGSISINPTVQERYCKAKHHLKCAKLMDCGMYALCHSAESKLFITYHDVVNKKWAILVDDVHVKIDDLLGLICTEQYIYVITLDCIVTLDLQTLRLTQLQFDGFYCDQSGMVFHRNTIYFIGGFDDTGGKVRAFDPRHGTSVQVGKMTVYRLSASPVSLGEYIYVIGGWNRNSKRILEIVERYNPETGQSTEIAPMLCKRNWLSCTVVKGKIYACGGYISLKRPYSPTNIGEIYDPLTDRWCYMKKRFHMYGYISQVTYNNELYAFGNIQGKPHFQVETHTPGEKWRLGDSSHYDSVAHNIVLAVVTNSAKSYYGKLKVI